MKNEIDGRIKIVELQIQKSLDEMVELQKELTDLYEIRDNSTILQRYYKSPRGTVFIKLRRVKNTSTFGVSYYAAVINLIEMTANYNETIVIDNQYFKDYIPIEKEEFDNACLTFYNKIKDEIKD